MKHIIQPLESNLDMEPLMSILGSLTILGYGAQFKATEQGLLSLTTHKIFQPNEIKKAYFYRFEGDSNPDDSTILYAIETNNGEKGTMADSYGTYNDLYVTQCMGSVTVHSGSIVQ